MSVPMNLSYSDWGIVMGDLVDKIEKSGTVFDCVVGVGRGGFVPAVHLAYALGLKLVPVSYSSKRGSGDNKNHDNHVAEVESGARVLIVDDICDSGRTMDELQFEYEDLGCEVYTACVYYKKSNTIHVPDYYNFAITDEDGWVNFPWDKA